MGARPARKRCGIQESAGESRAAQRGRPASTPCCTNFGRCPKRRDLFSSVGLGDAWVSKDQLAQSATVATLMLQRVETVRGAVEKPSHGRLRAALFKLVNGIADDVDTVEDT